MIFLPLALSCFAALLLAADKCDSADSSLNDKVESLQILAMKHLKPHVDVLPSFLETCKSWTTEIAWAYSIGRALGMEKKVLTQTSTKDNTKILLIHPEKVFAFLQDFEAAVNKYSAKTIGKDIFTRLFNMDLLRNKLTSLSEPQTLEKIRNLFALCVISTAGMVTLDLAILNWLDQEVQDTFGKEHFYVEPFVIESLCALSIHPQVEEYCTDKIMRVIGGIQSSSKNEWSFFFSFLNIIKQLDPCPIRTAIGQLAVMIFKEIYQPDSENFVLECRLQLGHGHEIFKLLETFVPAEEIQLVEASLQQIANIPEVFSLNDVWRIMMDLPDFKIVFLDKQFVQIAIVSEDNKLEWEHTETISTNMVEFQMQEVSGNSSFGAMGTLPKSRIFIMYRLQLPATILNEIKSCTDYEPLQQLMKRLCLTYGMTFFKGEF